MNSRSSSGVSSVMSVYCLAFAIKRSVLDTVSFFFVSKVFALIQIGVLLVYPVLKLYNGEKGDAKWMKWFFYLYYPIHLIVIGVLRVCIYGDVSLLF